MSRSIETRDGKMKHKTAKCTLVSKQNWSSLYGDKKSAKEKIFALGVRSKGKFKDPLNFF